MLSDAAPATRNLRLSSTDQKWLFGVRPTSAAGQVFAQKSPTGSLRIFRPSAVVRSNHKKYVCGVHAAQEILSDRARDGPSSGEIM